MTSEHITVAVLAAAILTACLVRMVVSLRRDQSKSERDFHFRCGYRAGWQDHRDGKPPKDFL